MKRKNDRHAGDAWFHVMDGQSSARLHTVFSEGIALESSVLNDRLDGAQAVSRFFDVFTDLCESLIIEDEAAGTRATYLAWSGAAFGGRPFNGVTSMARDDHGRISHIKVLCEPFSMLLRFSAAVTRRMEDAAPGGQA
jgi:hypothetical protein